MADKLKISILCDDNVIRTIDMYLGIKDPVMGCYRPTISKDFIEDIIALQKAGNYLGIHDIVIEKEIYYEATVEKE